MHTLRTLAIAGTLGSMPFSGAWGQDGKPTFQLQSRRGGAGGDRPMVAAMTRPSLLQPAQPVPLLPPLPDDTAELKFADFYQMPVGPRGLEPTDRLKELDGKKVRLVGYYVFEDWTTCSCPTPDAAPAARGRRPMPSWMKHVVPGRTMFAPLPVAVSFGHYGLCDDLPPQVAHLHIASRFGEPVFFRPGLFAATGMLEIGNQSELDGRISFVRLKVETEADIVPVGRTAATAPAPAAAAQTAPTNPTQTDTPTSKP